MDGIASVWEISRRKTEKFLKAIRHQIEQPNKVDRKAKKKENRM